MKIVVTSSGMDLDAPPSPVFGRCRAYVFVDTESMAYEALAQVMDRLEELQDET